MLTRRRCTIGFLVLLIVFFWFRPVASQGNPSFDFVKGVQARHERELFQLPGVRAVGIGFEAETSRRLALNVFINVKAGRPQVPTSLENVSVRVTEIQGDIHLLGAGPADGGPAHRLTYPPPVPMGVSTSNDLICTAGTLGFRVRDPISGDVGYITNTHVATIGAGGCPNSAPIGTNQFQSGRLDNSCALATNIGTLARYAPIIFCGLYWLCPNQIDAAFLISNQALVSNNILDIGPPSGPARDPELGEFVQKSGRTTGHTTAQVYLVNTGVLLVDAPCGGFVYFSGVTVVFPSGFGLSFVAGGDSGSPVLSMSGQPVGLVFAGDPVFGYGFVIPLPAALYYLGVELF